MKQKNVLSVTELVCAELIRYVVFPCYRCVGIYLLLLSVYLSILARTQAQRRFEVTYLPDKTDVPYQLRTRSHNMTLMNKTKFLNADDYLIRMLYKYSY